MTNYRARFQMMGTIIDLVVYHPSGEQLIKQAYQQLEHYAQRFTVNQPHSELMAVNRNAGIAPVVVEDDLFQLIKLAKAHSEDVNNPFNIAIGPLVKAWRIGFKDAKVPSPDELEAKLSLVDPSNILLDDATKSVYLRQVGMEIDLGAIAKGYFADQVKCQLVDAGVEHGFISLGGNVLTIGDSPKNSNRAWNVGIQNPLSARGDVIRVVPLKGFSMVTSGINERFFDANGQRYHHLLDAKTGMPIATDIASLTIISEQSVDGEIWSTAGFLSSVAKARAYIDQQAGIEAVLVSKRGEVFVTQGLTDQGGVIAFA
ncbi:FAD:protein FMN transferase [Vibrio panuliri]|uniref:FAD:protein FMN transferase n=1 Tax=Vibrio panuliri TaxID=1381081 RepID=A0ABX3F8U6_9VIBR|nr:FAD:protein FMN transferase [Vibrio panuliri]KAB1458257.1 FAD:protein FMN transferase [Vibrio panuliri]OLQ84955.1 thiamine biosynthesis protein ApbE [Vibrio panuliri]